VPRRLLRMRSDTALAERYASGDESAFDIIYERHRPVVLAVCMGVLGVSQDAEDATQETFSALAQALHRNPPTELRPWLTRVARNASIDTTRRRRHRLLTLDGEIPDIPARPQSGSGELETVLAGIRELPESQRTALLMRELGGHSYAEIAQFLETDEEAVRGLIARARVGLRVYREAAEMPCASARLAIEAEPDGRRHDKTVRRHLRTCPSCRSYRDALRNDAKALRALAPAQAGGIAGGGLAAGGVLTALKAALFGAGVTGVAASCAASVCAVGAVGGMLFVVPAHKTFFFLPPNPHVAAPATTHVSSGSGSVPASHTTVVATAPSMIRGFTTTGSTKDAAGPVHKATHHHPVVITGPTIDGVPVVTGVTSTPAPVTTTTVTTPATTTDTTTDTTTTGTTTGTATTDTQGNGGTTSSGSTNYSGGSDYSGGTGYRNGGGYGHGGSSYSSGTASSSSSTDSSSDTVSSATVTSTTTTTDSGSDDSSTGYGYGHGQGHSGSSYGGRGDGHGGYDSSTTTTGSDTSTLTTVTTQPSTTTTTPVDTTSDAGSDSSDTTTSTTTTTSGQGGSGYSQGYGQYGTNSGSGRQFGGRGR
jgi:RNA polymerase sigma factor (sigma-70 family)